MEGDVRPKREGGDRHSQRIEAHAELILSAVAAKSDITLTELQRLLSCASCRRRSQRPPSSRQSAQRLTPAYGRRETGDPLAGFESLVDEGYGECAR
jgi:hypothetical protein